MAKRRAQPRSKVFLIAFSSDGSALEHTDISYDQYYSGENHIIDNNAYRASRGIRRLTGEIYDSNGRMQQRFDNTYNEKGEYVHGRAVHEDGTVTED
jgi:hypothetical protein